MIDGNFKRVILGSHIFRNGGSEETLLEISLSNFTNLQNTLFFIMRTMKMISIVLLLLQKEYENFKLKVDFFFI